MVYTLQQLSDIQEIRDVALRYCRGVDRLDEALMKSAYWEDATDDHGVYVGPAHPFVEHCMVSHERYRSTSHRIMNHAIELAPDGVHARGEIYNLTHLLHRDEPRLDVWQGRYLDDYEKRNGEWRLSARVCVHEGTHSQLVTPMALPGEQFRQGTEDRGADHLQPLGTLPPRAP
ncbi:MAG: nuclear transport factor 2 family protein [Pseudomonadota bacterium]